MGYPHGEFTWTDVSVTDVDAAKAFYTGLFGWEADDQFDPDGNYIYTMFTLDGRSTAGMGQLPAEAIEQGAHPAWASYVNVDSVDDIVAKVEANGGSVATPAMDVFTSGRMAVLRDPEGSFFSVWQAQDHVGGGVFTEPGSMTWNELATRDTGAAREFYSAVFPWHFEAFEGDFEYWTIGLDSKVDGDADADDKFNGGVMPMPAEVDAMGVPSRWLVYFRVADTDGAAAKATELGGQVMGEAMDSPAGRIAVVRDPQGASFAIIAPPAEAA